MEGVLSQLQSPLPLATQTGLFMKGRLFKRWSSANDNGSDGRKRTTNGTESDEASFERPRSPTFGGGKTVGSDSDGEGSHSVA